jgi:hypothetical protein
LYHLLPGYATVCKISTAKSTTFRTIICRKRQYFISGRNCPAIIVAFFSF